MHPFHKFLLAGIGIAAAFLIGWPVVSGLVPIWTDKERSRELKPEVFQSLTVLPPPTKTE